MKFNSLNIICSVLLVFVITACSSPAPKTTVTSNDEGRQIIETGELSAVNTRAFVLQRYGRFWYRMKVIGLLDQGTQVKKGDSIIQLDPTEIKKYIVDIETQLEKEEGTIEKMLVDQSNQRSEMESNLKSEEASFNLKKLELASARFESPNTRKIQELEFKQAQIKIEKVKTQAALAKIIARDQLKVERIHEQQMKTNLKDARAILPTLTIRTPIPGIFQVATRRDGQLLKIGDQIWFGHKMGSVPDLTWMKVNTVVNEDDYFKIKVGQKVKVRLDAMPKVVFNGEISYIGKLCHLKDQNSKQKVFDVEVKMLQSDPRLKPGMTVSCEYIQD